MHDSYERVEFEEIRNDGLFLLIGERKNRGWNFTGRSTWECIWYQVSANEDRIFKAEQLVCSPTLNQRMDVEGIGTKTWLKQQLYDSISY